MRTEPARRPARSTGLLLLVAAMLAAAGPAAAQERAGDVPYRGAEPSSGTPEFARSLDSVVHSLGLPPLRDVALPDGFREVRLWKGFGIVHPFHFVRVVETPTGRRGRCGSGASGRRHRRAAPRSPPSPGSALPDVGS